MKKAKKKDEFVILDIDEFLRNDPVAQRKYGEIQKRITQGSREFRRRLISSRAVAPHMTIFNGKAHFHY